ncbi:hypothetical protein FHX49_000355 [Microbacterium endophyticum]|uniref:Uncharacterized protein n=1 Tax=Microbacterium endophyticum TaxID=1526412 RepID=A0A7W4YLU0_9MICO|nr:hypothetical protein [Microbacterium endophyticum]MBB2974814.1 hypothetical protein [Microbacterium endophyticum]NIK37111.1 hypothetical protein [Microbacterium endophyticum]
MTTTPEHPAHDGSDLAELRKVIDELASKSTESLIDPEPAALREAEGEPHPTEAIGSTNWNRADPHPDTESDEN